MKYRVTNKQGKTAIIEADNYVSDGSGVRFYEADGKPIASFGDGQIQSVMPEGIAFDDPAPEPQE